MTRQDVIFRHLRANGESMRALSLRAGLGEKFVADFLNGRSRQPAADNLVKLGETIGVDLLSIPVAAAQTWGDLIIKLQTDPPRDWSESRQKTVVRRIGWFVRRQNWDPATRVVDRREVVTLFANATPAEFVMGKASVSTCKSDILAGIDAVYRPNRKRDISDITGPWRNLHLDILEAGYPLEHTAVAGPLFVLAHDAGHLPSDMSTEILQLYFDHRVAAGLRTEAQARKDTKRFASLLTRIAGDPNLAAHGIRPVAHPFPDGRDKYGVPNAFFADLLAEFDGKVAPWVTGQMSRDGKTRSEVTAMLDAAAPTLSGVNAKLAKFVGKDPESRRAERDARMLEIGFLPHDQIWSDRTLRCRRGYVVSIAKAVQAAADVRIETVDELCQPLVLNAAAIAIAEMNPGDYSSGYICSLLKAAKKIALGYCCASAEAIAAIDSLISHHKVDASGICPRNIAKLRKFTQPRIDGFINLGRKLIADVNIRAEKKRKAIRKTMGRAATTAEIYDAELARDVMTAIAHEIMIKRAPRSDNVKSIRLDWIEWLDGAATIVIPAEVVKGRKKGGADLHVPLSDWASKLLRTYIDRIRPTLLAEGAQANPFLFPFQGAPTSDEAGEQRFEGILGRLVRAVHRHVGVEIHPHLYRHLLGWIWLKEDIRRLPEVQKLLGHRSLETTVRYYAQVDETLALQDWQDLLEKRHAAA